MPVPDDLEQLLRERFGHPGFLPGQREVVESVLAGRDTVAVMPTGGGKSLCYQLPALLLDGLTLVVSPLVALMKDQVDALVARGLPGALLNATLSPAERASRLRECREGKLRLLYVAPERLRSPAFLAALAETRVVRLAVDEAHCISQWGHDFRPDYLRLGELRRSLGSPPTLALTATATPPVRADIAAQLGMQAPSEFLAGFERPNLTFSVRRPRSVAEKLEAAGAALRELGGPGIVYAATRKSVEAIAENLAGRGHRAAAYHAGLSDARRTKVQDAFMAGRLDVIAATNAFGMGVDKPDIRFVMHHEIPGSLEAYYQEAGRAGRDGEPAQCCLLYSFADVRIQEFFLAGANPPLDLVREVYARVAAGARPEDADRNEMAVATAVGILERHGLVHRGPDGLAVPAGEPLDPRRLPVDAAALRAKEERDRARLEAMVRYAESRECRRAAILGYFTGRPEDSSCAACDQCLGWHQRAGRPLDPQQVQVVRVALSAVARLDDRFGRARLAQVLVGSLAEPVRRFGLQEIPTWGKLRGLPLRGVGELLERLADAGLLARRSLDGGGAVLSITPQGSRVMRDADAAVTLDWPDELIPGHGATVRRRGGHGANAPGSGEGGAEAGAADPELFAALRDLRTREAAAAGVPAYVVFHDRTLHAIAATRPADLRELGTIPGIGPAKLSRYGEKVLRVVRGAPAERLDDPGARE